MERMLYKCLFIFDVTKDETIKKEIISGKIVFVFYIFLFIDSTYKKNWKVIWLHLQNLH